MSSLRRFFCSFPPHILLRSPAVEFWEYLQSREAITSAPFGDILKYYTLDKGGKGGRVGRVGQKFYAGTENGHSTRKGIENRQNYNS